MPWAGQPNKRWGDDILDFHAFTWIQNQLAEELSRQGFSQPEPLEDPAGQAAVFTTKEVAYSLLYDEKAQHFELRSASLDEDGVPGEWRRLSLWLFDEKTGDRGDAESIANDFLDVVKGPKRMQQVQQKRKRGKDEERNIDPLFFLNRLVNVFPEVKEEMNKEKIVYGQVRPVTFVKENVVPKCEALAARSPDGEAMRKLCALLDDMYKNGDLDLRSIVTSVLLNGLSSQAFSTVQGQLGDELKKSTRFSRRLKGRDIKPEKKKKQEKVEARLDSAR